MKTGLAIMVAALTWAGVAAVGEACHRRCGSNGGWYGRAAYDGRAAAWGYAPSCAPRGHYEYRTQRVRVPGRWVCEYQSFGGFMRLWQPEHMELRTVRVWINH
jgi:hypothetical protein